MTNAEFCVIRERLGLSTALVARLLDVEERSVTRWDDDHRIPPPVAEWLLNVRSRTDELVRDCLASIASSPSPVLLTYRTEEGFQRDFPSSPFSAQWHRAWIGRVARLAPHAIIQFVD